MLNKIGCIGKGDHSNDVRELQKALVTWMPSWRGKLACSGRYDPQTAAALGVFKRVYGLGKDGNSLDPATRQALRTYRSQPRPLKSPKLYELARKHGFPFDRERRVREHARTHPRDLVEVDGHMMQAATAVRYFDFDRRVRQLGYRTFITATTEGVHSSSAHGEGRAVDCVIEDIQGCPITPWQSPRFADLGEDAGFGVFNEYLEDSTYKTGAHLHLEGP